MPTQEQIRLIEMVLNPGKKEPVPHVGSGGAVVFDDNFSLYDPSEFFTKWSEDDSEGTDLNLEIFKSKQRMIWGFKDTVSGDPQVYQNSDIEDGLGK